ncbi:MAG: deoxyribonuclease V [Chloroflexi bacterium]|nr:deoxyribonuclease V [Chloroflexota bacterium]
MRFNQLHNWDVTAAEARQIQERLRSQVMTGNQLGEVRYVAAADIHSTRKLAPAWGAIVVVSYPGFGIVEVSTVQSETNFPYVPGLLSFREIPVILKAWEKLKTEPDLVLVDGQGLAHPRRLGIASHLGLLLDKPTIGCAKSRLIGEFEPPGPEAGSFSYLTDGGEVIGAVVRTRTGVKPLFISIGHRIDLAGAIEWTLKCCRRYRLPEPARLAHQAATLSSATPQPSSPIQSSPKGP